MAPAAATGCEGSAKVSASDFAGGVEAAAAASRQSSSSSTSSSSSCPPPLQQQQHHHHRTEENNNGKSSVSSRGSGTTTAAAAAADVTRRMLCGGLAGMIAKTVTNPLDRIKMLSQTGEHSGGGGATPPPQVVAAMNGSSSSNSGASRLVARPPTPHAHHPHHSVVSIFRDILRNEGVRGLWAGNGANLLRVVPSKAIVFSSNDWYKSLLQRHRRRQLLPTTAATASDQNLPLPPQYSFLAGGLAGVTATAATYPLDLARGRIAGKLATAAAGSGAKPKKEYTGILQTLAVTVQDEGIRGLYKGMTPTLLGAMPYVGIQFGTVGVLERFFPAQSDAGDGAKDRKPSPLRKMLFGGLGGVAAGLVTYPNDTVRRLLQLQGSRGTTARYAGYADCVRQTIAAHGVRRLYRGLGVNLVRMAPNTAVQFGSYEFLKQLTADWV